MTALLDRQQSSSIPNVVSRCLLFGCRVAELPGGAVITLDVVAFSCNRTDGFCCVQNARHTDELGALSLQNDQTILLYFIKR